MELPKATVVPGEDKKSFKLLLNGLEIGSTKSDCDARFHMYLINGAIETAYKLGQESVPK